MAEFDRSAPPGVCLLDAASKRAVPEQSFQVPVLRGVRRVDVFAFTGMWGQRFSGPSDTSLGTMRAATRRSQCRAGPMVRMFCFSFPLLPSRQPV